jgi:hypothetical protein
MHRQSIIDKINLSSEFSLSKEEIQFILANWITIHSQHLTEIDVRYFSSRGIFANVTIDKDSFYKHF